MTDQPTFKPGETVEIMHGPFRGSVGEVQEVNPEKQFLKILVQLKNNPLVRAGTGGLPIELGFREVKKRN